MVFGEDEGKYYEAGYSGKDKGAKSAEKEENAQVARLRSRRKAGEATSERRRHKKSTNSPLEFTYKKLSFYFMLPLPFAARALEISHTSLKKICRELGIVRWPYVRGGLERFGRLGAAPEGNAHETQATSMPNADSAKSEVSEVRNLARIAFFSCDSTPATPASALDPTFRLSRHVLNDLSTNDLSWLLGNTTSRLREGDSALHLELVLGAHEEVLKSYT